MLFGEKWELVRDVTGDTVFGDAGFQGRGFQKIIGKARTDFENEKGGFGTIYVIREYYVSFLASLYLLMICLEHRSM